MKPNTKTPCAACCDCPAPTVLTATISASLYKFGFVEWPTFVSSPPKIFSEVTWSGGFRIIPVNSPSCIPGTPSGADGSGTGVVDRFSPCDLSGSLTSTEVPSGIPSTVTPNTTCVTLGNFYASGLDGTANPFYGFGCGGGFGHICYFSSTVAGGVAPSNKPCDPPSDGQNYTDNSRTTLSNEYTSAALSANTIASLPAYPDFIGGLPSSAYTRSADERSFGVERSKYKIRFPLNRVGNGSCYKLTWVERTQLYHYVSGSYVPDGDPTDEVKTFTWDGDSTDYDPTDPETWPITGEYAFDEPASNGEKTIGYYTDPDDPDTFVTGYILAECRGCA